MKKIILSLFFLLVGIVQPIAQTVVLPGFPPGVFSNRSDNGCFGGSQVDLNFAASSYCGGTLNNLINTSRASNGYAQDLSGTLINFGNNVPRITNQGLLIEEARTNLEIQSQTFDNAGWTKEAASVTADTTVAPDATLTADTLTNDGTTAIHDVLGPTITPVSATVYTISFYAKAGNNHFVQVGIDSGGFSGAGYANFDLNLGTVSQTGGTLVASGIVQLSNGWYRCWIALTSTSTTASSPFVSAIVNGTVTRRTAVTSSDSIIVWGAQAEAGSFPTSYIPTTTASATRAADVITLQGNALTSALAAKSAFFQTTGILATNSSRLLQFENNSATNEGLQFYSTSTTLQSQNGGGLGSGFATISSGGIGTVVKSAFGFDATSQTARANGGTRVSGANAWDVSAATRTILGNRNAGDRALNGYMQRFALSPTKGAFDGLTSP